MITYIQNGNIFDSNMQTLVNPVNCVGVMGKGLALEFKKRYPKVNSIYERDCERGEFLPGSVRYYQSDDKAHLIACFATKNHWKERSSYSFIATGLVKIQWLISQGKIIELAIPAIGCGLGGLEWGNVKAQIELYLSRYTIPIEVYEPENWE